MAEMNMEDIRNFLEQRLRELFSLRFAHLSEGNFNLLVEKAVRAAIAGDPNLRVRFGRGGSEGGGRVTSEIKIALTDVTAARSAGGTKTPESIQDLQKREIYNRDTARYKQEIGIAIQEEGGNTSLNPQQILDLVKARVDNFFPDSAVTKEDILLLIQKELDTFFGKPINWDPDKGTSSTNVSGVKIAKDKDAKPEVDLKQQEAELRKRVTKIFAELGEALHRAIPAEAVDQVVKSAGLGEARDGGATPKTFGPAEFMNTIYPAGAPAQSFEKIAKALEQMSILPDQESGALRKGDSSQFDVIEKKQVNASRESIKSFSGMERISEVMYRDFEKMAAAFNKMDPRFLGQPGSKLKLHTEESTQASIGKASFVDEMGVVRQATVVLDKYGDTIATTTNRHASFFQGIARDVREFTKWSIAIALVYTPMQKLKELIDLSIRSQTLLADTIVTLGETQDATNKIFESAADIAETTGSSILGVIEGYNLALRAAGDAADVTERYRVANQLLTDSITLAKLSTLSQAEATDVLVAALKQTNTPLDQGQILLDKWVKVTRVANVDLTTLATSFSIVGEAAKNAGLGIDELNGLVALMASQTGLSAKETGNAVRALVSGYTSDPVVKELGKFGIAVKKMDGDARDFQDVMMDIKTAFEAGLISESQLNKIAYAIGGGNRRQAQVVTSIINLSTMNRVAGESANANGEAQKALGIELDTVATKSTILSNSFTELAQAVGMEGGLLSGMSSLLSVLTLVSKGLTEIVAVAGTAGPVLGAMGIGAFLGRGKEGLIGSAAFGTFAKLGQGLGWASGNVGYPMYRSIEKSLPYYDPATAMTRKQFVSEAKERNYNKMGVWGQQNMQAIGASLAIATMAGLRAAKGDWEGFGIIMGTGIATGLATKNSTFAMMGATIASAILSQIEKTKMSIGREAIGFPDTTKPEELTEENSYKDLLGKFAEVAGISEGRAAGQVWAMKGISDIQEYFGKEGAEKLNSTQVVLALLSLYEVDQDEINAILESMANRGAEELLGKDSSYTVATKALKESGIDLADVDTKKKLEDTKTGLRETFYDPTSGMSPTSYRNRLEIVTGSLSTISEWVDVLNLSGEGLEIFGEKTKDAEEVYNELTKVILDGTDEQLNYINTYVGEIKDAFNDLEELKKTGTAEQIEAATTILNELQKTFPDIIKATLDQISMTKTKIPSLERQRDLGEEDFNIVKGVAERLVKEWGEALSEEEKAVWENSVKNQRKLIEIAPGEFKEVLGGVAEFFGDALNFAIEDNLIEKPEPPGLQQLDISKAMFDKIKADTDVLAARLTKEFGYESEKERLITELDDKQWYELTTDWKIFNILLQEILDTEKQQLEGIYNLPANGSFFVPFQARQIEPGLAGGIDTANLEAGVDNAGDQVKLAIELAAAQIADAILVEKMVSERGEEKSSIELAKDKFTEDLNKWIQSNPNKDVDRWATDQTSNQYKENYDKYQQEMFEMLSRVFGVPVAEPDRWATDQTSESYKENYNEYITKMTDMFMKLFGEASRPEKEEKPEVDTSSMFSNFLSLLQRLIPLSNRGIAGMPQQQAQFLPMSGVINTSPVSNNLRDSAISQANMTMPASQQRLNLNISSNVNLRLDGRMVANVVKRYLGESLLRYSSSSGSISRSVIV